MSAVKRKRKRKERKEKERKRKEKNQAVVAHSSNPSSQGAEAPSEFEASLVYRVVSRVVLLASYTVNETLS